MPPERSTHRPTPGLQIPPLYPYQSARSAACRSPESPPDTSESPPAAHSPRCRPAPPPASAPDQGRRYTKQAPDAHRHPTPSGNAAPSPRPPADPTTDQTAPSSGSTEASAARSPRRWHSIAESRRPPLDRIRTPAQSDARTANRNPVQSPSPPSLRPSHASRTDLRRIASCQRHHVLRLPHRLRALRLNRRERALRSEQRPPPGSHARNLVTWSVQMTRQYRRELFSSRTRSQRSAHGCTSSSFNRTDRINCHSTPPTDAIAP